MAGSNATPHRVLMEKVFARQAVVVKAEEVVGALAQPS
jgi:hypothetical protein